MDMQNYHMKTPSKSKAEGSHPRVEMTLAGRDYVTQHVSAYGPRCHHKLIYACPICNADKRYFLNLMPKTKFPFCDGITQKLQGRQTNIIARMEAMQQRFGRLQLEDRADWTQDGDPPAFAGESEADYNERTNRYGDRQ